MLIDFTFGELLQFPVDTDRGAEEPPHRVWGVFASVFALEKPEVARAVRSSHLSQLNTEATRYQYETLERSRPALEYLAMQIYGHFQAEILNRELAPERRRSSPPESGPVELWQGQVAALERSLSMARLTSSEASAYIQEFGSGRIHLKSPGALSILLALVSET